MRKVILGLFVTAALVFAPLVNAAKPGPSYVGQGLGVLPGDTESNGYGVNDAGSVVGRSFGPGGERAFYWDRPTATLYQLTTSGATGWAFAISGGPGATAYAVGYERAAGGSVRAVIWIAPPTIGPTFLDGNGSSAHGVNDGGVAVGQLLGLPAMWSPTGNNTYARTDISLLPNHETGFAQDIDNDGIVVGDNFETDTVPRRGFLRLLNGSVIELAPAQGDSESSADAVSDVFIDSGNGFVYVAGLTTNASGVGRGVRWTVNVDTGVVVDQLVLSLQFATGVNGVGDVAGASLVRRRQSATLWRDGAYIALTPPKGGGNTGSFGMSRQATSPTFVVGTTIMRGRVGILAQAVIWEVN